MMMQSKTLTIPVNRPPDVVYRFAANPENFPKWVTSFCKSIRREGEGWIMETTMGPVKMRFTPENGAGILDHWATPATGGEVYVPMRVFPNGDGSEVTITIFKQASMSAEQFAMDIGMVIRDLATLKKVLES